MKQIGRLSLIALVSFAPDGRQTTGIYAVKEDGIKVSFALPDGKVPPLMFVSTPDRHQMLVKSPQTGRLALHEKVRG